MRTIEILEPPTIKNSTASKKMTCQESTLFWEATDWHFLCTDMLIHLHVIVRLLLLYNNPVE
jgi:hypothetical protein